MPILNLRMYLEWLEGQDPALGPLLVGVGLIFLLLGLRIFRFLVAVSLGCVGLAIGAALPLEGFPRWVAAAVCAVALAFASRFFIKLSVAVLVGLWAGGIAAVMATAATARADVPMIAAAAVFIIAFAFAFVLFEQMVAAVTSFEGSLLILGGLVVLLSRHRPTWVHARAMFLETPVFTAFILIAGTIIGLSVQLAETQKKRLGTSG